MYFSPRKFLISTRVPLSWMTTLMGKWAYTDLILWRNPRVTPLIMFWTWLQMVRTVASSFLFPHHLSTRSFFCFFAQQTELQVDVVERPDELATGPLDNNCPPLQPHLDIVGDVDSLTAENGLHS